MKITRSYLKRVIKEELSRVLIEQEEGYYVYNNTRNKYVKTAGDQGEATIYPFNKLKALSVVFKNDDLQATPVGKEEWQPLKDLLSKGAGQAGQQPQASGGQQQQAATGGSDKIHGLIKQLQQYGEVLNRGEQDVKMLKQIEEAYLKIKDNKPASITTFLQTLEVKDKKDLYLFIVSNGMSEWGETAKKIGSDDIEWVKKASEVLQILNEIKKEIFGGGAFLFPPLLSPVQTQGTYSSKVIGTSPARIKRSNITPGSQVVVGVGHGSTRGGDLDQAKSVANVLVGFTQTISDEMFKAVNPEEYNRRMAQDTQKQIKRENLIKRNYKRNI